MKNKNHYWYMIGSKDNKFIGYVFPSIKEAKKYRSSNPTFILISKDGKMSLQQPIRNIIKVKIIKVDTIFERIKRVFKVWKIKNHIYSKR